MTGLKTGPGTEFDSFGEILEVVEGPWLDAHRRIAGIVDTPTDETSDCEEAIQDRLIYLAETYGGGRLLLGPRVYKVFAGPHFGPPDVTAFTPLVIQGMGRGITIVKRGATAGGSVFAMSGSLDCELADMTVDNNWGGWQGELDGEYDGASGSHAIQSEEANGFETSLMRMTYRNLHVRNARGYGIAHGGDANYSEMRFFNVLVENTSSDGIDTKNDIDENYSIIVDGVHIKNWGLSETEGGKCGMDCRGKAFTFSNYHATEFGGGTSMGGQIGLRFRQDTTLSGVPAEGNGPGGDESTLTGFYINSKRGRPTSTQGIAVASQHSVSIANGTVQDVVTGVMFNPGAASAPADSTSNRHSVANVHAIDCDKGFWVQAKGHHVGLSMCTADQCDEGIRIEGDFVKLVGFTATNCDTGILVPTGADGTVIAFPTFEGNALDLQIDSGATNTIVIGLPPGALVTDNSAAGTTRFFASEPTALPTVVAAATLTLPKRGEVIEVTGNTNITTITAGWAGRKVWLKFTGTPTLTAGNNIKIAASFVASGNDVYPLICDGTNWLGVGAGSVNPA